MSDDEETFEENSPRLMERVALMTVEQIHAVRSFLLFVTRQAEDDDWLKRFAEAALQTVWLPSSKP